MAFDPAEALSRWGDRETTVIMVRESLLNDRYTFENLRDAVLFAKADATGPIAIQVQVHLDGMDVWIKDQDLVALGEIVQS